MEDPVDELDYLLPANCPSPYMDTWDRHNSIAFSATKGLRNAPGENNCFVNCAVQVLWHLDVFRRSYRRLSGHTCMGHSCIFCALKVIFTQFQYSDKSSLHPDALRKALAQTFANQQRFQLGHMDDAAECFENILRRIHFHVACQYNEDSCQAQHCLPHQKFSMAVLEKVMCSCGASTNPLKFNEMVHYVSASALIAQSRLMRSNGDTVGLHPDHFGLLLRKASAMGDVRNCPANCGKQVQKQRTLLNIPDVVSVGLVWDSDHPSMETTSEVASSLGTTILLPDMYNQVMPDPRRLPCLELVAVVCYYGKHYSTFVFHSKLKTWVYFDDATVREIGPLWKNVVDKCSRGRFQPLLLLYANPMATPVHVDTAPQKRVMAPGYVAVNPMEDSDSGLDRTHDSIRSVTSVTKRSTTPSMIHQPHPANAYLKRQDDQSPRPSSQDTGRDSPARLSREHSRQPSFLYAMAKEKAKQGDSGEGGGHLPGGAAHNSQRHLLDGGANSGHLQPMPEDTEHYTDYTLSSGGQYRRPSMNGVDSKKPLPMPPNVSRLPEQARKDNMMSKPAVGRERGGVDVIRYQVDPHRTTRYTAEIPPRQPAESFSSQKGMRVSTPVHHGQQQRPSSVHEVKGQDMWSGSQHVVLKPKPTGHGQYDPARSHPHTAVQSGLATLPRPRAQHHGSENVQAQGSSHQEVAHLTHHMSQQRKMVNSPLPPGTPPPEYNAALDLPSSHSRQTSVSSQASSMKSSVSMCNINQILSEKQPDSDRASKMGYDNKDIQNKMSEWQKPKTVSVLKKSESESDLTLTDKSKQYIKRHMVENILKHQGVHRHGSSCSNSSVESDTMMARLQASKAATTNLTVSIPLDTLSLGSHKDSGYGSSDRNSASSAGSGSVDPCTQYFFTKSMVIPRSITPHNVIDPPNSQNNMEQSDASANPLVTSKHPGQPETSRKVMHPIKESSQEDMARQSTVEPIGTQKFILANTNPQHVETRPPPVPPKNFAQFHIIKSSQQQSASAHEREVSLEGLKKDGSVSERFISLCKKADALMEKSGMAEAGQDRSTALHCCEGAIGCLKEAMSQEVNNKALAYLQKRHNACLLKSRSLQKRVPALPLRQESHSSGIGSDVTSSVGNSRSSLTSSDSDITDQKKDSRQTARPATGPQTRPHHSPHPSTSSLSSQDRVVCGQGQRPTPSHDGKNNYNPPPTQPGQKPAGQIHSTALSHRSIHGACLSQTASHDMPARMDSGGNSADLYGTLPRNKSRKPGSDNPASAEVYQSFLKKQKSLQSEVMSSQQSLDSVRSDSVSEAGGVQNKMNKSGIRQLLQESIVQRQWHQSNTVQQNQAQRPNAVLQSNPAQPQQEHSQPAPQRPASTSGHGVQHSQPVQAAWHQQTVHSQNSQGSQLLQLPQRQPSPANSQHPPKHGYHPIPSTQGGHVKDSPRPALQGPSEGRSVTPTSQCAGGAQSSNSTTKQNPSYLPHNTTTDMGRRTQNIARVVPYSHVSDSQLMAGGSSYLVMMPPSQHSGAQSSAPFASRIRHSSSSSLPPSSSSSLTTTSVSRPLEQHASQPSSIQGLTTNCYAGGRSRMSSAVLPSVKSSDGLSPATDTKNSQSAQSVTVSADSDAAAVVNVRDLASRFEKPEAQTTQTLTSGSHSPHRRGSLKSDATDKPQGQVVRRTRSKSESFSRRPKSVLKNSKSKTRPRKSVTFAESLADFSKVEDSRDDEVYFSDYEDRRIFSKEREDTGSCNSEDSAVKRADMCQLCHKRCSNPGQQFCSKCSYYIGKLKSS